MNAKAGMMVQKIYAALVKVRGKRLKLVNELFGSMKVVKMYAWEQSFQENVNRIREEELGVLTRFVWLSFIMMLFFLVAPEIVNILAFAIYTTLQGETLTASTAFTTIALFNLLRFPMAMLPRVIVSIIEANVSFKRISEFLSAQEIDEYVIEHVTNEQFPGADSKKNAMAIRNAQFAWDDAMNIIALSSVNIDFVAGDITMVIGETGSGKSTLLSALLGQINKIDGGLLYYESPSRPNDNVSVSYSSQVAWIQNATVRDNILFGREYDKEWYDAVTFACALISDFEQFDAGDMTEIGEK